MNHTSLAIVGIGCLFPKAEGTGAYWANIKHGVDCIGEVPPTHWNPDDYFNEDPKSPDMTYAKRGGFLSPVEFNPLEFGIAPRDLEATDTSQILGLVAAKRALDDAKVDLNKVDRSKVSVILGVTGTLELVIPLGARLGHPHWKRALKDSGVADDVTKDVIDRISESYVPWQENSFPGLLGNVVAGRIANRLDLHGTNCVVDAACASSLSAMHLASMELQTGKSDIVVTGGADTFNDIFMFMCFSKTPALSKSGNSKPFDANGDGTILGEGIGIVVLKRLADAERDGDRVYAIIRGMGTSSDGKGNAIYAPSAEGQKRCLKDAYARSGVAPDTIEMVEAHGTGTKVGDATEASALADVYGSSEQPRCIIGSVKSQIGHTKAAAGAASLIKAALSLYNKVLPPTIKVTQPVEPLAGKTPFSVNLTMRPWVANPDHPRRAAVSAFGFGGSNFHAVLEEHSPIKANPDWDGQVEIWACSKATNAEIVSELDALTNADWNKFARSAAKSRLTFDVKASCRLVLVAHRDTTDLKKLIDDAKKQVGQTSNPPGIYYGSGLKSGEVGILFPGQGSQSVGMLRTWACTFPEFLETLNQTNSHYGNRLSDVIYPPTSFSADAKSKQDDALRATNVAQPALGAASFGAWRVLHERFGLKSQAFAGHSYGELTALAAAERLTNDEFMTLSILRGRLMAEKRSGEPGTMLAVIAPLPEIEKSIRDQGLNVVVANKNSPTQCVVSGTASAIARAAEVFGQSKIRTVRLPVADAFHSPLVADAAKPFRAALNNVEFPVTDSIVYANSTAAAYPTDAHAARDLLGSQLANPVEFVELIRSMTRAGVRTFVEVGPGNVLSKLTEAILTETSAGANAEVISVDGKQGLLNLAQTLARLAARGIEINLAAWEHESLCRPPELPMKPVMTIPICGANYRAPYTKRPPTVARPTSENVTMAEPASDLQNALLVTQQTLTALQRLQEQTAQLHKQFLEQQESAQRTLHSLVAQQQSIYLGQTIPQIPAPPLSVAHTPITPVIPVTPHKKPESPKAPAPQTQALVETKPVTATVPQLSSNIDKVLLGVVAEKTGYPVEMLNLDMTLDSDLGVDSIKRVEILSALQDKLPSAPVVKPEHLGTLHSLRDVALFLNGPSVTEIKPVKANGKPPAPLPVAEPPVTIASPVSFKGLFESALAHSSSDIAAVLLGVVAEKTGYPVEMLNLDMSMDSDLGVDSIKRVEILSALQDKLPDAPVVKPEHLGTLHTLRDVAEFLGSNAVTQSLPSEMLPKTETITAVRMPAMSDSVMIPPDIKSGNETPAPENLPPKTEPLPGTNRSSGSLQLDKLDRSIPQPIDLDLTATRQRIQLPEGSEIWLIATESELTRELTKQFSTQRFVVRTWPWQDPKLTSASGSPAGLLFIPPSNPGVKYNHLAVRWLQFLGASLRVNARTSGVFVSSVVQLDGAFGLVNPDSTRDPELGGLAGLIKTVRSEWPELQAKAIDVAPTFVDENLIGAASAIAEECLLIGPVEVGINDSHRCTVELARTVRRTSVRPITLTKSDVILVTGGARGVTAEVAVAFAECYGCTTILTGRTPLPAQSTDDYSGIVDEAGLKAAIAQRLGSTATPKIVGDTFKQILAAREVNNTIARIENAGAKVAYYAADVANPKQLAEVLNQAQSQFGPITAVIHGAGVLADRKIEDLSPDQFDSVYSVKVQGMKNLLDLLAGNNLKAMILFSSTTARLGRTGQLAYAMANEVLNKIAQIESRKRTDARVVAINWGPWEGGMVTPALRKVFDNEGVGLIPLADGASFAVQELSVAGRPAEVIALGKQRSSRSNPPSKSSMPSIPASPPSASSTAPPTSELSFVFERTLDLDTHPLLKSHILDHRAVLPMSVHMEWLAHAALHGNPGLIFHGFNEFRITNGVMIDESTPSTIRALAGKAVKNDKYYNVPVEIRGKRRDGRDVVHSRGEVVLMAVLPKAPMADKMPNVQPYLHPHDEIYRHFLFHGPDLQGIERIEGVSETAIIGSAFPAPSPMEWFNEPFRGSWLAEPLVLDTAFQMMILWSYAQHGAGSLPCFLGRYRQYRRSYPITPVRIVARVTRDNGSFARADIDLIDSTDGSVIGQINDYECVIDPQLNHAFRRNQLGVKARV